MGNISIRNVEEKDLKEVVKIQVTSWQDTYKNIIDNSFLDSMNIDEITERRKKDYQKGGFIVAIENNEIVGFSRYVDTNQFTPEYDDIDCEIIALYVRLDKKHKGIGKMMFNYIVNEFKQKNKKKMIIWCLKENYPSKKFYERMGGVIKGEHNINFGGQEYPEVGYEFILI